MRFDYFMSQSANKSAQNRLLKFMVLVIGAATVLNSLALIYTLNQHRTILVPPGLAGPAEIRGNAADEQYISAFSRYVSQLAFSYNPGTVRKQAEEILLMCDPEYYQRGKTVLYDLADRVMETRFSSVFYPHKVTVDFANSRAEITGNRMFYADDRKIEDSIRTYLIGYRINGGKYAVTEISEKEKQQEKKSG